MIQPSLPFVRRLPDTGPPRILELFAGSQTFTRTARDMGLEVFSSDYDPSFGTDYAVDIMEFDVDRLPWRPDVVWASPPCESFSVASIGHHWGPDRTPKSEGSIRGIAMLDKTLGLIAELRPRYYFIENPRGMMRKMPQMLTHPIRHTVTYCQYGDTRMKPTDIWTNCDLWTPRPKCRNGDKCHEAAPRGSGTGTQGIRSYLDRSTLPEELCIEILQAVTGIM